MQGMKRVCADVGGTFADLMDQSGVLRRSIATTTVSYPTDGII